MKIINENFYGDDTRWWLGIVVDNNDPLKLGRVRPRIYGIHDENTTNVPDRMLPWASVIQPTTEGGTSGIGANTTVKQGAQVLGIFADGKSSQIPIVIGIIPKIETTNAYSEDCSKDPGEEYPLAQSNLDNVNSNLESVSALDDFSTLADQVSNFTNNIKSMYTTSLGSVIGEVIGGFEALTQINDNTNIPEEFQNTTIGALTGSVSGAEDVLTVPVENGSDLGAITGGNVGDGTLNEVFGATTPIAIDAVLAETVSRSGSDISGALEAASSGDYTEYVSSAINDLTAGVIDNSLMSGALSSLQSTISNVLGSIDLGGLLDSLPDIDIPDNYQIGSQDANWNGIDTKVSTIRDACLSGITSTRGDGVTSVGGNSGGTGSYDGSYEFMFVDTFEELEADFRSATRDITEVVAHWSAHYNNQGHVGSEEIHRSHIEDRGWSGIGYHYVIKKDGRIQRGRPINRTGAHALDNGHNNYSIGVSMIGGYNCNSGTPNKESYVSAESLTSAQMDTFNRFMNSFYNVWPGGQAWGHVDTDNHGKVDPGFSVADYVYSNFNKTNTTTVGTAAPLSPTELSNVRTA